MAGAALTPAKTSPLPRLTVSENHRFLTTIDGKPFFWMADTAWQLVHALTREEVDLYLTNRASKGFNVVQTVAIAEHGGLRENAYGHRPFLDNDPARPDTQAADDYWNHLDYVIQRAEEQGLYVGLLPT